MNEDGFRYFKRDEFKCQCGCDTNEIRDSFIERLDQLRYRCGFPFVITSGFRCKNHEVEAAKETPGKHNKGAAADIRVNNGMQRRKLVEQALDMGFGGVGVAKSFVHVDDRNTPVMWTY